MPRSRDPSRLHRSQSKDYGDGFKPSLKDATDGLSNTIMLAESAGRPFVYRGRFFSSRGAFAASIE